MMEIDNEYYSAHCDLTNSDSCTNEVEKVIGTYGKIDVVANIAGGFTMGETVYETSEKTWEFMLNLNTLTVLNMAKAAIPKMIERKARQDGHHTPIRHSILYSQGLEPLMRT